MCSGRFDVQFVSSILYQRLCCLCFTNTLILYGCFWPLLFAKDGSSEANDAEDCKTGSTCFVVLLALYLYVVLCVACISWPDVYTVCVGYSGWGLIMWTVARSNTWSGQSSCQVLFRSVSFCFWFCCLMFCHLFLDLLDMYIMYLHLCVHRASYFAQTISSDKLSQASTGRTLKIHNRLWLTSSDTECSYEATHFLHVLYAVA